MTPYSSLIRTDSSLSARERFNRHVDRCFQIIVVVCLVIVLKVGLLQLTNRFRESPDKLKAIHLREEWAIPPRGRIVDRHGVLLATSLPYQTVVMDPHQVRSLSEERKQRGFALLEKELGVSPITLARISRRRMALVPVERGVDVSTELRIQKLIKMGGLPGIRIVTEQVRAYPWADYTRSILGTVRGSNDLFRSFMKANVAAENRQIKAEFPWYRYASINGATPQRGIGGIEQALDPWLAGTPDRYLVHLDKHLYPIENTTETVEKGTAPGSVVLTIDSHLQRFVARLVQATVTESMAGLGMVVVMETHGGRILAAYSTSYDDGRLSANDSRIFTSSFECGSAAKPLMMLYAFSLGVIDEDDRFDCNVSTRIGDQIYRDSRSYSHDLSPREILTVSSDSGMAQIVKRIILKKGSRLAIDMIRFFNRSGIGRSISLQHTAIARSTLPSPDSWSAITPSQIAIGYEFKASPFHLASVYSGFANGGRVPRPSLVENIIDGKGRIAMGLHQEEPLAVGFPPRHASLILDYLKSVVSEKEGTGRKAAVDGFQIAGKTGTARRLVNGKYSRRSHNSTFVGILPLTESPSVVIGVFFQDIKKGSDYGGDACAPLFREIAEHIIGRSAKGEMASTFLRSTGMAG